MSDDGPRATLERPSRALARARVRALSLSRARSLSGTKSRLRSWMLVSWKGVGVSRCWRCRHLARPGWPRATLRAALRASHCKLRRQLRASQATASFAAQQSSLLRSAAELASPLSSIYLAGRGRRKPRFVLPCLPQARVLPLAKLLALRASLRGCELGSAEPLALCSFDMSRRVP